MTFAGMLLMAAVLPPWTPVETDGTKVSVWGRDYTFAEQAMPVSITSAGDEILAGPIRFRAAGTNAAEAVWSRGGSWIEEKDAESATVASWQESQVVIVDAVSRVEYDGMVKVTVTAVPTRSEPVRSVSKLWLEIPLKPEFATLRVTFPRAWGNVDNAGGVHGPMSWPFRPSVWVGNEEKGLCWYCESGELFINDDPKRVVELIPGERETVLRIRFADHFDKRLPMSWTFALHATPAKPFDRAWNANHVFHHLRVEREDGTGEPVWETLLAPHPVERLMPSIVKARESGAKTVVFHEDWIRIQNDPDCVSPAFRQVVDAVHKQGMKVLAYLGYEISPLDPLWQKYGDKVIGLDDTGLVLGLWARPPAQRVFPVCYNTAFAADWLARAKKAYDATGIDGYYLDGTVIPSGCANLKHGCGWKNADGALQTTYPIFAVRDMMKELYTFVHARGGVVNAHQSGFMCPATLDFCDAYWDGEHLAYAKGDIRSMLNLEVFRAEFIGRNIGVPCEFLSAERPGVWTHADGLAVSLIHDVLPRPNLAKMLHYYPAVWKAMDDFGTTTARWTPYWKSPLSVSPAAVKASVYEKDGAALVVASNLDAAKEADAEIALPAGTASAVDAITGEKLPVADGKVKVNIKPFRFVFVKASR